MLAVIIIFAIFCFPLPRFLLSNFYRLITWGAIDTYYYFKEKRYNLCPYFGKVWITSAYRNKVFGSGKTLDISMIARMIYHKYNGLEVWSPEKECFVKQHIHIISNITFNDIPYTKFITAEQFKNVEQAPQDVTIFVFDEIGAIWNSRNYKDNISTELLKELLQCRKSKIFIIGSSQRFRFVDVLLRQITGSLFCVTKFWRILKKVEYDPVDFENCTNTDMIRPLSVEYKFILNKDYNAYDTSEKVSDLLKLDMLPDSEVVANQAIQPDSVESTHLRSRLIRRKRRQR